MPNGVDVEAFLAATGPILDVRSPGEFARGHLPGAVSFPLFSDAERAEVGTCYKQEGRDRAIELGLKVVGPKLTEWAIQGKALAQEGQVRVHCWRGGMRSSSMAWLLATAGLRVTLLTGGYKAFRQWIRTVLAQPKPIMILGGMTGVGKTAVLQALAELGEAVLDLEGLANHRGSSYGGLDLPPQPTTEQFENLVAMAWRSLPPDPDRPVWIEAESRGIGVCRIPAELFEQMQTAPMLELVRSPAERIAYLEQVYGGANRAALLTATARIQKRLGGQRTQEAIAAIQANDLPRAIAIVLSYYDKTYRYNLERHPREVHPMDVTGLSMTAAAIAVRDHWRDGLDFAVEGLMS